MAGSRRSFKTELKKHCPAAITVTCICHKIALIAKDAFKVFPIEIDKFLQDLVTFTRVPAPVVKFRAICKRRLGKSIQLTKYCTTRCLSRYQCISKILECWDCLVEFVKEVEQDFIKNETFAYVRKDLENSGMYATLLFLGNVLKIFKEYNVFFQSKHNKVHLLSQKSFSFLHKIGNKFLTSIVKTSLKNNWDLSFRINFEATENQLDLDRVNRRLLKRLERMLEFF